MNIYEAIIRKILYWKLENKELLLKLYGNDGYILESSFFINTEFEVLTYETILCPVLTL